MPRRELLYSGMWRNRSILLCHADATRDGNVDRIGREILDGFRANGWAAVEVMLPAADPTPRLVDTVAQLERGEFDLVLSVQDMGMFGGPEIDAILARGGARRLYWALDHPYSCWQTVAGLPPNAIVTYPTRGNIDCAERFLRRDRAPIGLAHGAMPRDRKPWAERTIPALFVGNAPAVLPETMRRDWRGRYPAKWAGVLEAMAAQFDPIRSDSLDGLADEALAARGIDPAQVQRSDFMLVMSVFDAYAWALTRLAYVGAMRGAPVTIVGRGWESMAVGDTSALGPLPTDQARASMDRAQLVLNILPAWYRSHERVFEGMAAGCAVATTGHGTIANATGVNGGAADEIAVYHLGPPDGAGERLGALLNDHERLRALAEAGHAEFSARHKWSDRVKSLLNSIVAQDGAV